MAQGIPVSEFCQVGGCNTLSAVGAAAIEDEMNKLCRALRAVTGILTRLTKYCLTKDELQHLDEFTIRDMGIARSDFEAIARGRFRR